MLAWPAPVRRLSAASLDSPSAPRRRWRGLPGPVHGQEACENRQGPGRHLRPRGPVAVSMLVQRVTLEERVICTSFLLLLLFF